MRSETKVRPVRIAIRVLAAVSILVAAAGSVSAASQHGNIVFILDGSGSMWGKLEGKAKIDIAKEVMARLINDLPAGVDVGLVVYGHRSKGDCNDVEELVPLGAPDKSALIAKVNGISPKGMTPITFAVRTTVEKLKGLEEETTVLLVSDGEETCKGDPCALVKELKASGIKFVMHVIGFDVGDKEKAQLECLAKAGGGRYFAAKNAKEFQLASRKVTESVSVGEGQGKLVLAKKVFQPLEKVVVTFTAQPDYAEAAWIGLIPSAVPHTEADGDASDIAYEYIKKRTTGQMTFQPPRLQGSYDLRMFNSDTNGKETASVTFEVKGTLGAGALKLDKDVFAPGEAVNVRYTAGERFASDAWVALFKSDVPHGKAGPSDEHDIAYQYLSGKPTGVLTFRAPYENASYDLRMFDTTKADGDEAGSVTFTVKGEVTGGVLALDKTTFLPGEEIRVRFKGSPTYHENAWVGLVPSDVAHGTSAVADEHDVEYKYLSGKLDGTLEFRAPIQTGAYDLRMFDDTGQGKETASVSFTVRGEMEKGTIKLDRSSYRPGEKIILTFTASAHYKTDAWIGLIPSSVPHGKADVNDEHDVAYHYLSGKTSGTFEFKAPEQSGRWDFRMNNAGLETASVTLTVR